MKCANFFQAGARFHKDSVTMQLHVTGDLEMVFLLANECVVRVGKIEAFVGVHTKVRRRSVGERFELSDNYYRFWRKLLRKQRYIQFLLIVIAKNMPELLLERWEADALNLRVWRWTVATFGVDCFHEVVAALVLVVFAEIVFERSVFAVRRAGPSLLFEGVIGIVADGQLKILLLAFAASVTEQQFVAGSLQF